MRPIDIYAVPAIKSEPWYDGYGPISALFGDELLENDLDREAGRAEAADDLAFEEKLYHNGDGNRTATFLAATLKGLPFAVLAMGGRGGAERVRRVVTDLDAFRAARAFLETRRIPMDGPDVEVVAPGDAVDSLSGIYGYRVVPGPDGALRLVPESHLDRAGRMVFDEVAFRAAFDAASRGAFDTGSAGFDRGLRGARMRELASEALAHGIPPGLEGTIRFTRPPAPAPARYALSWAGLLVASPEGVYAIGCADHEYGTGYSWMTSLRGERVGEQGDFAGMAARSERGA